MKFFNIADAAAFFEKVLSCSGNVYCRDDKGRLRDLKLAARQLGAYSWLSRPERLEEIDVVVEYPSDGCLLYRYMMEAAVVR